MRWALRWGFWDYFASLCFLLLFLLHLKIEAVNQMSVKTPCLVSPLLVLVNGLLVFGEDFVAQIEVGSDVQGPSQICEIDDRWDHISGIAFTDAGDGSLLMSMTSHLSTLPSSPDIRQKCAKG